MKHIKEYDEFINEAKHSKVFKSAKKGSYPVSLVVVKNGKVIDQELVNTPEAVPAAFNVIQSKHKGATVHIEDKTGKRLFSESVNEAYDKRAYDSFIKYLQKNAESANLELFDPIPVGGSIFNKDYEKADNVLSFDWNIIDGKYTGSVKQKIDNFFKKAAAKFNMKPIHIQVGSVEFVPASPIKESSVNEEKYNTVEKVVKKLGRRPSEEELASFITKNYYDVTGVKRQNDDPSRNAKIADLISFYNFDPADFEIAWHYAQNESELNEGKSINAIQKEWAKVTTEMKTLAQKFKGSEGDEKTKILSKLKDLTKRKKQLESDLDDAVMSKGINQELSSVDEAKVNLKADHLSSAEYQKAKKLKGFNPDDWKWNPDEDLYVKITK